MSENKEKVVCSNCEREVNEGDDFCTNCGSLFLENIDCEVHNNKEAIGVCAICHKPICRGCAGRKNDYFLCKDHSNYEIYQGMARVYGTSDSALSDFVLDTLKKGGFHPFNYSRKVSPIAMGGVDYSLYRASGEFNGHLINEIKTMVPLWEVLDAEKLLKDLDIV